MAIYLTTNDVSDQYDDFARMTMDAFASKVKTLSNTGLSQYYNNDAPLQATFISNIRTFIASLNAILQSGAQGSGCIASPFKKTSIKKISGTSASTIILTTWVGGYTFQDVDIDFVLIQTQLEDSLYSSVVIEPVFEDVHM